jgi:N-acetyl-D-muramate 6-phosphate phosphatase
MISAVLFDLDGTLADTAPDLALALNRLRAEYALEPVALELARPRASGGARALIELGFGMKSDCEGYAALAERFLELYGQALCVHTRLFEGVPELLAAIEQRAMPLGIVTNKAERFVKPLVAALGLEAHAACVVSGDTTSRTKPAPEPLLFAAEVIGRPPQSCLYVGDDLRDVQAARAAGMAVIAAGYGYLGIGGDPASWGADGIIAHPIEALNFLS